MRKSEAKLEESEGWNGIGEDDYKAGALPTLPRKTSFPRKQIYRKILLSYSKWSIRKIVMMAWIHVAAHYWVQVLYHSS
jgi:hypothetical protein